MVHLEADEPGYRACHFHSGPWAGRTIQVRKHTAGPIIRSLTGFNRVEGRYVRDEMSAGGRQYDWHDD